MNNNFGDNSGYQYQNPFTNEPQYDFYDEIVVKDAKRAVSRSMLSLVFFAAAVALLVNAVAYGLVFFVYYSMGDSELYNAIAGSSFVNLALNAIAQYAVGIPVVFLVIRKLPKKPTPLEKPRMSVPQLLMMIPIAQTAMVLGGLIGTIVSTVLSSLLGIENNDVVSDLLNSTSIPLVFIFTVVLAPIFEELLFRKLLLDRLSVFGNKFAILMTAVAFGLWHGTLEQLFYATLVGIVLGYVAVKSGKWYYCIIIHMVMNFIGGIMTTLVNSCMDRYMEIEELVSSDFMAFASLSPKDMLIYYFVSIYQIFAYMLFVGGIVLLVIGARKRWFVVEEKLTISIPRRRVAGVIFKNVGTILFLVVSGITIITSILMPVIEAYISQMASGVGV